MRTLYIERFDSDSRGTLGVMTTEDFECHTLELRNFNNAPNISCIPIGKYTAKIDRNVTIGKQFVIRLRDVPNRTGILIHVGNYTRDIAGCVLVGHEFHVRDDEKVVTSSRNTMQDLLEVVGDDELEVEIVSV